MDVTVKKYLAVLRRPVFLTVVNFFLVNTLFSLLPFSIGNIAYNTGRMLIMVYAGWLIQKRIGGRWRSAFAGAAVYFVDHVLIKGGIFLLNCLFRPEGMGLSAVGGVLVSFIVFIPAAMLFGALGGLLAPSREKKATP